MSKKDLSYYINKDVSIIKCKKRAKELFNLNKNSEHKSLTQYKDLAAIELGFKSWFDLQSSVKKKCSLKFNIWEQQLTDDFESLLKDCFNNNATDIHIEVRQPYGRIRSRINGELIEYKKEENSSYDYLCDFSNVILNQLFSEHNISFKKFSTGSTFYNINNQQAIVRIQSVPAYPTGFDLVLRVNYAELYKEFSSLTSLGYSDSHVKQILEVTSKKNGCFILAGTTGQGTTTTLRTLVNQLQNNSNRKIDSIENGIEYPKLNKEITQIQCVIDHKHDFLKQSIYEESIKKSLSSGAEVILVDETRDKPTAQIIGEKYKSSLFLTSVHTSNAISIIFRLEDFGLNKETIARPDFCNALASQKLLPVLCPHCSQDVSTVKEQKDYAEYLESVQKKYPGSNLEKVRIRNDEGCSHCHCGVISRTVCAEIIVLDHNMREFIKDNNLEGLLNYWRSLSDNDLLSNDITGKTIYEHALSKMLLGQIDPIDVLRNFYPFE
jgi:general secretion pathway protein E